MLKWNTQNNPPSNNGEIDIFADISTRYVSDIQCAIEERSLDNNNVVKKVIRCNTMMDL